MMGATRQMRVWACAEPVNMGRSFEGLYATARNTMGREPLAGDMYLFVARNRKQARVLYWDGTGLVIIAKYLNSYYTSSCFNERVGRWQFLLA